MIYNGLNALIGRTPLVRLNRFSENYGLSSPILAKLEAMNPGGSAKDRAAMSMIDDAEASGRLKKGGVIVEPTSGNTGIGLAAVAAARGYKVILTMPDTMSVERRQSLAAFGAELVLTEGKLGMNGAVAKAEEIVRTTPNAIMAGQFTNPANAAAHERTTGPELWQDTDGKLDILVATIGTGGTITGCARYLKAQNPKIHIIGVEPENSPLLTQGHAGAHKIQGIGANFVPEVLDKALLDEVYTVSDTDAYAAGYDMAHLEGLLVGISSGAALCAAARAAKAYPDKLIAAILPDTGLRYLSTGMFDKRGL